MHEDVVGRPYTEGIACVGSNCKCKNKLQCTEGVEF